MATNLNLDDTLIAEAMLRGAHASKREAVNAALKAHVNHLKQLAAVREFGSFVFEPGYDYEAGRKDRDPA